VDVGWRPRGAQMPLQDPILTSDYLEALDHHVLVSLPLSFVRIVVYGCLGWLFAHQTSAITTRIRSGAVSISGDWESREEEVFTESFFAEDKSM